MTDHLRAMVDQLDGAAVVGGCDHCDAYQTIDEDPDFPRTFHLRVHHDDWCPFLPRINGRPRDRHRVPRLCQADQPGRPHCQLSPAVASRAIGSLAS